MTELLGINYPAPPDAMPRLQRLRHLFAQGLDFERDTVAWLLEQAEARDELDIEVAEWELGDGDESRGFRRGVLAAWDELAQVKAARDALADECAELRRQLSEMVEVMRKAPQAMLDNYNAGVTAEREACARVAETTEVLNGPPHFDLETWSRVDIARATVRATTKDIAAAIRARGATASSQPAEPLPCTCADGPPKFEPPKPLEFGGEYMLRNAAAWFTASTGKCTRCGGAVTRGETQPPGQARANTTAGASGAATDCISTAQVVARLAGPWHHCRTGARQWPAGRTEPCPVCGTAWGDAK